MLSIYLLIYSVKYKKGLCHVIPIDEILWIGPFKKNNKHQEVGGVLITMLLSLLGRKF